MTNQTQHYEPQSPQELLAAQAIDLVFPTKVDRLGADRLAAAQMAVTEAELQYPKVRGRLSNDSIQRYTRIHDALRVVGNRAKADEHLDATGAIAPDHIDEAWKLFLKELATRIAKAANELTESSPIHNGEIPVTRATGISPGSPDLATAVVVRLDIYRAIREVRNRMSPGAERDFLDRLLDRPDLWPHLGVHGEHRYIAEQLGYKYDHFRTLLSRLRRIVNRLDGLDVDDDNNGPAAA